MALVKAEKERDATKVTLGWLEKRYNDHATAPMTENKVAQYLTTVTISKDKIEDTFQRIAAVVDPADLDPHSTEYESLLDRAVDLMDKLTVIQKSFIPATKATPPPTLTLATIKADIQLPRLNLPTFDGKIEEWTSFRDLFRTAIHDNVHLSDSQRLAYLKAQLKGEAARQVQSLVISDANYAIAAKLLEDRYQNDRQLLFTLLKRFTQQQPIGLATASSLRQLIDGSKECIRSLEVLAQPVQHWDALLLFTIHQKLDSATKELYEQGLQDSSIPKLQGLFDFLEQRSRALEAGGSKSSYPPKVIEKNKSPHVRNHVHHAQAPSSPHSPHPCKVCAEPHHPLYKCAVFLAMTVDCRIEAVRKNSLCFNCLRSNHPSSQCPSAFTCRTCSGKHNSLLHRVKSPVQPAPPVVNNNPALNHHASNNTSTLSQTLLATAIVLVKDTSGQQQPIRLLLDGGSDVHIIRSSTVKSLGLRWNKQQTLITGLSSAPVGSAYGVLDMEFSPHIDPHLTILAKNVRIMTTVTGQLPRHPCDPDLPHLNGLQLADEKWHTPDDIDMLVGASLVYGLINGDKRHGQLGQPFALSSDIGWLVVGEVGQTDTGAITNFHTQGSPNMQSATVPQQSQVRVTDVDLDKRLRSFWELEEVPFSTPRPLTQEEQQCEEHYVTHTTQQQDGRFVVSLPFKTTPPDLGSSREMALQRLRQIERRLARQPAHKEQYVAFMKEYLDLGHMEVVPPQEIESQASKTGNGKSLNSCLLVGATIQDSLFDILLRFRTHIVAFTADVAKMYRQILVAKQDADYQRILWREDPSSPVTDYRLLTVTYGTASAPFQATRTLEQAAINKEVELPLAAKVARNDVYVDDVMSGADSLEQAIKIQEEILLLMQSAKWEARRWNSSHPALIDRLPVELRETKSLMPLELGHTVKTLGIYWQPNSDQFLFQLDSCLSTFKGHLTKRIILSEIAKIFDPIGWLAPVVITAKMMMQQLWKLDLGWYDPVPIYLADKWTWYKRELQHIEDIKIPRCVKQSPDTKLALVGFCDASERAYSAVTYLCCYPENLSPPLISVIASKTRVTPSKTVSLPRLELCGAVLLSHLMETVSHALKLPLQHQSAWTDSTVTLDWIRSHPSRWNRFVANRVTEIQNRLPSHHWGHVSGVENPADCASRGLDPSTFTHFKLWWNGPDWLSTGIPTPRQTYPKPDSSIDMEERREIVNCNATTTHPWSDLLNNCSSLLKLQRVTAWCTRFTVNTRPHLGHANTGPLTPAELHNSLVIWVKIVQAQEFRSEIQSLQVPPRVDPKSPILSLNPFLDKNGVLRVGGRIHKAPLPYDNRHPILLPRHGRLTQLLIIQEHEKLFHCGQQLLLSSIQTRYWIIRGRDAIRHQLRKCVRCTRQRAATLQQFMANLPQFRLHPCRAFTKAAEDYAGPFLLRPMVPRSTSTIKSYLAIFVCCVTRAIHLELVSAMTTDAFIAALRRFIARRGCPTDLYSDCGTNFVGANHELRKFLALSSTPIHNQEIANQLSRDGIQWHFNPPGAPHFNGLAEAGVKSVKYHLTRIIGQTRLTFEEMTTTITQVEAVLNSRPITAESSDPSDLAALTPGHSSVPH
ncbi:uncharacterized protein LOC110859593 [Folsomia candida]|uniref:Pro-Pol polyprotein n=1 Tax=Folsomia candida TaxID=158441 RepID=A0A226D8N0_FOLCA|nr:uncharacterized protein LOC110859593 [Folsomia candida]OXA41905.1 Pro-Pol polyprotein [Folsomia candida]